MYSFFLNILGQILVIQTHISSWDSELKLHCLIWPWHYDLHFDGWNVMYYIWTFVVSSKCHSCDSSSLYSCFLLLPVFNFVGFWFQESKYLKITTKFPGVEMPLQTCYGSLETTKYRTYEMFVYRYIINFESDVVEVDKWYSIKRRIYVLERKANVLVSIFNWKYWCFWVCQNT